MTFKAVIYEGDKYSLLEMRKFRSKQSKPYADPLAYSSLVWDERDCRSRYFDFNAGRPAGTLIPDYLGILKEVFGPSTGISSNERNEVWNKALAKVDDKLTYITNLFEAWYERKEAYQLLGSCLKGILTFVKRWKDPRYWVEMRKIGGKTIKDPKSLPQAWLLFNFAIKPLVGTIEDIFKFFSKEIPYFWVDGASGLNVSKPFENLSSLTYGIKLKHDTSYIVKHGVRIKMINPNMALINAMGLSTPVSTAMSVVPWGWAVNYFINVNDLISNFEIRWPGVELDAAYSTTFIKKKYTGFYRMPTAHGIDPWLPENGYDKFKNPLDYVGLNGEIVSMNRTIKQPDYKVHVTYPPLGSSSFANLTSAIALTMAGARKG